jgi:hypothetical protein
VEVWPLPRTERRTPSRLSSTGFCFGSPAENPAVAPQCSISVKLYHTAGTETALCRLPGIEFPRECVVVSGPYLRQQAEILIAISRTSFDLGVARRLREVASELQAKAAEQDSECT